jgi:hypothetical protein
VEASVLRLPALSYRPIKNAEFDIALPNALSEEFTDVSALIARARHYIEHPAARDGSTSYGALIRDNIASLEGPLSCQRIVAALRKLSEEEKPARVPALIRAGAHGRHAWRELKKAFSHEARRYEAHKSDTALFTGENIKARARPMAEALGRFRTLRYETLKPGIVTISA